MRRTPTSHIPSRAIRLLVPCIAGVLALLTNAEAQNSALMPLTLPQAIDLALKQNRDLKLAQLSVVDTEHKKEIARSAYLPHISNNSGVLHITDLEGVEIPAGAFGNHPGTGAIPGNNLFIDQGGTTWYVSGTSLDQPFTQMFKIHESNRSATADINTARIHVRQTQDEVALQARQLYYGILIAQLREQAANEEVSADEVKIQESTGQVERGEALNVTILQNRASSLEAKQNALVEKLQTRDLTIQLNDLLGLPLTTQLQLDANTPSTPLTIPTREECLQIAREHSPAIQAAEQAVVKAKANLAAAKDAYIPDISGLARYSYQSDVPFLVHNYGTFGFSFTYDLFDGGKRIAQIKDARTELSEAQLTLEKAEEEISVQVETAYDKIEQLRDLVGVAQESLSANTEAARVADRQFEQNEALASVRAEAHAKAISARASLLEANLSLALADGNLKRIIGQPPR